MKKLLLLLFIVLLAGCKGPPGPFEGLSGYDIMEIYLNATKLNCSGQTDEVDMTFCYANNFIKFKQEMNDMGEYFYDSHVQHFCLATDKNYTMMCYVYVAARTQNSDPCQYVINELDDGCYLLSEKDFCRLYDNKYVCMEQQARLMEYINPSESAEIRRQLAEENQSVEELDKDCDEIAAGLTDMPFEDRFVLAYATVRVLRYSTAYD